MKRQINRYFFMATLAGLSFTAAFSQRAYTLDECLEQALANNVRLKNAQNNLQMAKEDKANAFTKYFPNISATGGGVLANKGLLEMEMQPGAVMSMADKGLLGGVTATLPLFTGGQIVNGNKLAALQVEVNQLQLRQSENEVRLTTEQYYWQVVSLKEKLHTLSVLEEQLTRLQADVEASVEAGVVNRNDLLQVQLKQNETQSSRINVENALTLSRNLLAQYMGLGIDSVEVTFTMDNRLPEDPTQLYAAPESALGQTNEYHLLQQNVKASQLQKRMAVGKNLPTVAIGGGYAYENLLDRDHDFWVGFATVSIPLFPNPERASSGVITPAHINSTTMEKRTSPGRIRLATRRVIIRHNPTMTTHISAPLPINNKLYMLRNSKNNEKLNHHLHFLQ